MDKLTHVWEVILTALDHNCAATGMSHDTSFGSFRVAFVNADMSCLLAICSPRATKMILQCVSTNTFAEPVARLVLVNFRLVVYA